MARRRSPNVKRTSRLSTRLDLVHLEDRNAASDTLGYLMGGALGVGALAYLNSLGSDRDVFGSSAVTNTFDFESQRPPLRHDDAALLAVSPDFLSRDGRAASLLAEWLRDRDVQSEQSPPSDTDWSFTSSGTAMGGEFSIIGDPFSAGLHEGGGAAGADGPSHGLGSGFAPEIQLPMPKGSQAPDAPATHGGGRGDPQSTPPSSSTPAGGATSGFPGPSFVPPTPSSGSSPRGGGTSTSGATPLTTLSPSAPANILVVGPDAGGQPRVKVYDPTTHQLKFQFLAYASSFHGGVRVAVGDVNGDGTSDIITGTGPGAGSNVRVFNGKNGNQVQSFQAFDAGVTDGVYVAAGDVTGDGKADIVVGTDSGSASPMVRVFDGANGSLLFSVMGDDAGITCGARVAVADVNGDGRADVITANGPGAEPRVCVFDGVTHKAFFNFIGTDHSYRGGLYVTAGDLDGDGKAEIVTSTGTGTEVRVFRGSDDATVNQFSILPDGFTGGSRVAVGDFNNDGYNDLAVGSGVGGGLVRLYDVQHVHNIDQLQPYGQSFADGLFVGSLPLAQSSGGIGPLDAGNVVTVVATKPDTAEGLATPGEFTFSRTGSTANALYVTVLIGGTAGLAGPHDYTFTNENGNFIAFAPGAATTVVTVNPIDDTVFEKPETVVLTVTTSQDPQYTYSIGTPNQAVVRIADNDNPPPAIPPCNCGSNEAVKLQPGVSGNVPSGTAAGTGVDYATGITQVSRNDLSSDGFGTPWGFDWSWTNTWGYTDGKTGNNSMEAQLPYLRADGSGNVVVFTGGKAARYFDASGMFQTIYTSRYMLKETLADDFFNAHEFTFRDTTGNILKFNDFHSSLPANKQGTFKSFTDTNGNVTSVTAYTSDGKPQEVQQSNTTGGTTVTDSYLFTYLTSGSNAGKMSNATLRRKVNTGSWTTIRQADYTYYDGTDSNGTLGDLKMSVVKDGGGTALATSYYRYYVAGESLGNPGDMKYAFSNDSWGRLGAAFTDPTTATNAQIAPYADAYYEYDIVHRVTKAVMQGSGCSSCSGGLGTFTYSYITSPFPDGYNNWRTETIETLPDGNQNIVYLNCIGEPILEVYEDATTQSDWSIYYQYDNSGRLVLTGNVGAVSGYDDTTPDMLNNQSGNYQYLNDSTGLLQKYSYGSSTTATTTTAGDVAGYQKQSSVQQGETGTAIVQSSQQYIGRAVNSTTVWDVASTTAYRNTDGTGGETTSESYTYFSSQFMPQSVTTTLPTISSGQNGPGSADTSIVVNDAYGRPIWTKDADGFINYTAYDQSTGAVTKTITDVDTTQTGDFTGLPSGWSTPTGGGLHLKTLYEVDSLGRTTKVTDPNGNVTYTVYNDSNHEVRMYPGWDSVNNVPTGPTEVSRQDLAGSYTETLTMSATPHLTSGRPDGTESIGSLQTLSRSYTSAAGQVDHTDEYFNLSGLTYSTSTSLGTENTNFYRTRYGYDDHGRQDRVQSPTGTITRTVFDGQGRDVSTWIGLDDTPTTGEWDPNNTAGTDLVKVSENVYDSGGVGDGNLTQVTEFPGGGAANRVSQFFYDWRDREVASKSGVQASEDSTTHRPISYTTYDNLSEATQVQQYDGDGVTITSSGGVPQKPSSSLLRAETDTSYDDQGRVYQTQTYSVNPNSGAVSTYALTSKNWYNHRGDVIKSSAPGGPVTKYQYDGAGRTTKTYTTEGGGDSSWSDAGNVTGDAVVEQVEMTYDSNGNVILTTTRERNHDETATGALGNATTTPKARVSYNATYYDKANRPTDSVDVGTNGGSAWTRPSSVPSRSDSVLVNSMAYTAAGFLDSTTDPRGIVTKEFHDNLGRTTKSVEAYDGGSITNNTNKTTEYTFDGAGHTLTLQADLTGGAYQKTQWTYGTNSSTSDGINSNDILKSMQYPDPSTGNPSASSQEVYTVNSLGQVLTKTDRNGNVHTYSFDVLGRPTADAVTTLGSGVDGSVRRIETAFDTQGNAYLFTSYDAATAGNIVNQVQRAFNGLGQLITEYQAYNGAVNTGTTPKVQYTYSEMSAGANHSRLTGIIYPNGRTIGYNYASGLADSISRLSSITDSGTTLESYSYLGLGTVVIRSHPQPGVDLTYVKQTGESNGDAGDQYIGLDRFGRVIDQRWILTSNGNATDRFQYGYDRDGNRLYRDNLVNSAFGELYHANGSSNGYDNLNQLQAFARGTLNSGKDTISSPAHSQSWGFDALGNWTSFTTDGTTQTRSANAQNEITSISSLTTPTYDANGNMTGDQTGKTLVYDAWNRLVQYKNGSTVLLTYTSDALNRRITDNSGTLRLLYYSSNWQVLEERVSGSAVEQYVWSPVYVDAMIERDRDTDANGSLDERLYVQQDANWNVTAVVSSGSGVLEREVYDPYGAATYLSASWGTLSGSAYAWVYLHQGGRFEIVSGLGNFRNREYSVALGRWVQIDPSGFSAGDSDLYRYQSNEVTNRMDPTGLGDNLPQGLSITSENGGVQVSWAGNLQVRQWFTVQVKARYCCKGKKNNYEYNYPELLKPGINLDPPLEPGEKPHDHQHVTGNNAKPNWQPDPGPNGIYPTKPDPNKPGTMLYADYPNAPMFLLPKAVQAVKRVFGDPIRHPDTGDVCNLERVDVSQRFFTLLILNKAPAWVVFWRVGTYGVADEFRPEPLTTSIIASFQFSMNEVGPNTTYGNLEQYMNAVNQQNGKPESD